MSITQVVRVGILRIAYLSENLVGNRGVAETRCVRYGKKRDHETREPGKPEPDEMDCLRWTHRDYYDSLSFSPSQVNAIRRGNSTWDRCLDPAVDDTLFDIVIDLASPWSVLLGRCFWLHIVRERIRAIRSTNKCIQMDLILGITCCLGKLDRDTASGIESASAGWNIIP